MLELHPDRIDLWFVFFDEIHDDHLLHQYRNLLTEEERGRERRFHFARDRHRYLLTRAMVRTVLSRYAAVAPAQWAFSTNAFGMPTIANDLSAARRISFNISHTSSLIVLAVTGDRALGVDTENIRARPAPLDAANHFFSSDEALALSALPACMQHDRFFQYWTLKESYIKARGMGLSIPLDKFGFDFSQDSRVAISMHPQLNDQPSRWHFWQFRLAADYMVAVCAERSAHTKQQLFLKKIIPLSGEEVLDYMPLRESACVLPGSA